MSEHRNPADRGVDHGSLAGDIGMAGGLGPPDLATSSAGELLGSAGEAVQDGTDLVEGHGENVVQHERQPLGGSQRFEYHEQGGTDRVGQLRFVFWLAPSRGCEGQVGRMGTRWLLAP